MPHSVRQVLAEGGAALAAAGIETAGLDASLLLAESLNVSRSSLIAASSDSVTEKSLIDFYGFIKRRLNGECVAYITGRKEFYGLEFLVNPSVLVPRPETETLVETAVKKLGMRTGESGINSSPLRVLDLCTGSGAVAIALKHLMPELDVWATDISPEALEVAKANAVRLLPNESIHFCHGDLFSSLHFPLFSFHIIVSNPPYVPTAEIAGLSPEVRGEPLIALDGGGDGLDIIKKIVAEASKFLRPGGVLLMEADPRQTDRIAVLLEEKGFIDIQIYKDLSGGERVIGGKRCIEDDIGK